MSSRIISTVTGIQPEVVSICVTAPSKEAGKMSMFADYISALLSVLGELNGIGNHYTVITEIRPERGEFRLTCSQKDGSCVTVTPG